MVRRVASALYAATGVVIAVGAYGHGFRGRLVIDAELAKYPIQDSVFTMLYVVWYFVSACMAMFGAVVLMSWIRQRRDDRSLVPVVWMIAAIYIGSGVLGYIYRQGDPFMLFFVTLGSLLLVCGWLMDRPADARKSVAGSALQQT